MAFLVTDTAERPLYKAVGPNGEPLNGGSGNWPLPHDGEPGYWREVKGDIVPCSNGLHLCTRAQLSHWLPGNGEAAVVYRAEVDGELWDSENKYVARKVRLLPRARLLPDFAALAEQESRARRQYQRRVNRAIRIRDKAATSGWLAYAAAVGGLALKYAPPGTVEALTAYNKAVEAAQAAEMVQLRKIAKAREAAILPD